MTSSPSPTIVQQPFQQTTEGTNKIEPYAPVEPYIQFLLPEIGRQFTEDPQIYTGSLVPQDSAQTLAARDLYGQVGDSAAALVPSYNQLFQNDLARATADPLQDSIYQAQTGVIANRARELTERDKQLAQEQAIQAGQFGLGSTALGELQALQQSKREEVVQKQLADSLAQAEQRRIAAGQRAPGFAQQALQAQLTPATLQEAIGQRVELKDQAALSDAARLAQQEQEARRAQLITMSNLYGGLAGLGSQTQMQQTSSGFSSSAVPGGPGIGSQLLGTAATIAPMIAASDVRLKKNIKFLRKLNNGVKVYSWNWNKKGWKIAKGEPTIGVIAQQVRKIIPEAVVKGSDGYFRVDYSKVGL